MPHTSIRDRKKDNNAIPQRCIRERRKGENAMPEGRIREKEKRRRRRRGVAPANGAQADPASKERRRDPGRKRGGSSTPIRSLEAGGVGRGIKGQRACRVEPFRWAAEQAHNNVRFPRVRQKYKLIGMVESR